MIVAMQRAQTMTEKLGRYEILEKIGRMKEIPEDKMKDVEAIYKEIDKEFDSLQKG